MEIGVVTEDQHGWCSIQFRQAMQKHNIPSVRFGFDQLTGRIEPKTEVLRQQINVLKDLDAPIMRLIWQGSMEETVRFVFSQLKT